MSAFLAGEDAGELVMDRAPGSLTRGPQDAALLEGRGAGVLLGSGSAMEAMVSASEEDLRHLLGRVW